MERIPSYQRRSTPGSQDEIGRWPVGRSTLRRVLTLSWILDVPTLSSRDCAEDSRCNRNTLEEVGEIGTQGKRSAPTSTFLDQVAPASRSGLVPAG